MAEDFGKLVLRLGVGGMLLFHGVHKLLTGLDPVKTLLSAHGLPDALAYIAYLGEIVGPLLVLLGLFTRAGAFLIILEILALMVLGGVPRLLRLSADGAYGLEAEALYVCGALALLLAGGGRFGLSRGPLS